MWFRRWGWWCHKLTTKVWADLFLTKWSPVGTAEWILSLPKDALREEKRGWTGVLCWLRGREGVRFLPTGQGLRCLSIRLLHVRKTLDFLITLPNVGQRRGKSNGDEKLSTGKHQNGVRLYYRGMKKQQFKISTYSLPVPVKNSCPPKLFPLKMLAPSKL